MPKRRARQSQVSLFDARPLLDGCSESLYANSSVRIREAMYRGLWGQRIVFGQTPLRDSAATPPRGVLRDGGSFIDPLGMISEAGFRRCRALIRQAMHCRSGCACASTSRVRSCALCVGGDERRAGIGSGIHGTGREKQEVFPAGPREGFTPARPMNYRSGSGQAFVASR